MNVSLSWWGMTKNSRALNGQPMMSTLSHDYAPRKHVFPGGKRGKCEGLDSGLGPDAILCVPVPALQNSPWLQLMLPARGACMCKRNCPPPAITPLKGWSQYCSVTWAAVIGQRLHRCTAARLTQSMIHKWFFSYCNADRDLEMNPVFQRKADLRPKGWLKSQAGHK